MKTVYIVRHAKSSWDDPELTDVIRPLNPRGKKASVTMGKYLAKLRDIPDLIISSPATRAYHTALNISRALGYRARNIRVDPSIYYDGEHGVFQVLKGIEDEVDSVFIVGHEPTCSDVIYRLCGEMTGKFSTASVFKIEMDTANWKDIERSKGKKIYFVTPKRIKDMV